MIFVVSGEGPSDIGKSTGGQGECSGADFVRGPMAALIEQLADTQAGFSFSAAAMEFVSESRRLEIAKEELSGMYFRGKKRHDYEEGYYFKEARALAIVAKRKAAAAKGHVAPVLFRDADSNQRSDYRTVRKSIEDGFKTEGMEPLGVAMVPQPTSEAWLICALQSALYQNCAQLEETLSGSGAGCRPAKPILEALLTAQKKEIGDLYDLINAGTISAHKISMPSYDIFRQKLEAVVAYMLSTPWTAAT
jgi:hypothetical protein